MKRDYVVETTDGSAATMKIAMGELIKGGIATTWLAAEETYTDRLRQTRTLKVSVFPGYLLVELDVDEDAWKYIHDMRGVKRLMCSALGTPIALPIGEVDRIKARFQAGEFKLQPLQGVAMGDKVVFEAGAYAGKVGVVKQSKDERIGVLMTWFGAEREVLIRRDMVRRAVS